MKWVLYTNSVSAHQLPLAREIVKRVGADNFRYVYTGTTLQGGNQEVSSSEPWITQETDWLESCDVLLCGGLRPIDLLERRSQKGLKTFYQSERWFKPIPIGLPIPHFFTFHFYFSLPGALRLLVPSYRKMARRFVRLMNEDPNFFTLPIGVWAKRDFLRLGVMPEKMRDWAYFVSPSALPPPPPCTSTSAHALRVLWVGRMLWWKRVDTIIRAVAYANRKLAKNLSTTTTHHYDSIALTLVGDGEEYEHLVRLASGSPNIFFRGRAPIAEIRSIMREHDIYVLSSNALEGWGAALSEAIAEGLTCYGTYEAGASASLLPSECLFKAGDWRGLAKRLRQGRTAKARGVDLNSVADIIVKGVGDV